MRFGKSVAKCSCEITGGGGFVKVVLLLLLPISLVFNILLIVYPINAWLSPFDQLVPQYPVVNQTREVSFSFRPPPIILPTYNVSKFHSSNFELFDSEEKNHQFYRLVPFLVQSKGSLLSAFRKFGFKFSVYYFVGKSLKLSGKLFITTIGYLVLCGCIRT